MSDWFAISDLPRLRILKVRVLWGAHELVVTRTRPRGESRWAWFEDAQGEPREVTLDGEPNCWQPISESFWSAAVPRPLPLRMAQPRMVSETVAFTAVAEAEAADLAREMEADRETARVQVETTLHIQPGSQWWWNPSAIRYEPAGSVAKEMAEGRLMRALAHAEVGKGLTLHSMTVGDVLAQIADARALAGGAEPDPLARFTPLPQDHADFLVAMSWYVALNPPERRHKRAKVWGLSQRQKVLAWMARAVPLSSGDMAALTGRSDARMRQVRAEALEMVHRVANGLPAREGWPVVDHMAALQERNRAYRRSS